MEVGGVLFGSVILSFLLSLFGPLPVKYLSGNGLQYRSKVSRQSFASRSSSLDTQFSILENFEDRVSSRVSRLSRRVFRVSSRETNELVA